MMEEVDNLLVIRGGALLVPLGRIDWDGYERNLPE